jgi:hypothetical protein
MMPTIRLTGDAVEADFDSFNSCHVPARFTCDSSLHLNRLRKPDVV